MKKTLFSKVVVFTSILSLVACSSPSTFTYTSRSSNVNNKEIIANAEGAHVRADFSRKVTATSDPQLTREEAVNEAQFKCIQQYGIDVVVDPIYKVDMTPGSPKPYVVTVLGFAGTYIREDAPMDEFLAKNYSVEDIEKYRLLNDPSFARYYYSKEGGEAEVTNYYINGGEVAPAPQSAPQAEVQSVVPATVFSAMQQPVEPDNGKKKKKNHYDENASANSHGIRPFGSKPSDKFSCGIELGYLSKQTSSNGNLRSFAGTADPSYSPGFRFGFLINPTFKYGLGFKSGFYMDYVNNTESQTGLQYGMHDIGFAVPLQVSFRYELVRKLSFMFFTGPVFDMELFWQRGTQADIYSSEDFFDVQWGVGAGIQYGRARLMVGGEFGMVNQNNSNGPSVFRQKPVYVTMAIMF